MRSEFPVTGDGDLPGMDRIGEGGAALPDLCRRNPEGYQIRVNRISHLPHGPVPLGALRHLCGGEQAVRTGRSRL